MTAPWTPVDLPDAVRAVAARDALAVAALDDGRLARSDDGGATWSAGPSALASLSAGLLHLDNAVLAGTARGVVRVAAARAWAPVPPAPLGVVVTALAGRGAVTIAGTARSGVFRSADGGIAWEAAGRGLPLDGERLRIFAASAGRGGLVVAHALGVSRSTDGGRSWSTAGVGLPLQVPGVTLAAAGDALYAAVGGRLYRAVPGGGPVLVWAEVYDGVAAARPLHLLGGAAGALYGAADGPPALVVSADGGATWADVGGRLPMVPVGLARTRRWLLALGAEGVLWRARRSAPAQRPPADLALDVEAASADVGLVARFALGAAAPVRLVVCDALDQEVACLADRAFAAGPHLARLPGGALAPGLYRLRLQAGSLSRAVPFVLLG
ncbi:WD40/YVTN/BNR-like repeat-containing protein [Rubrivirga marina]|uniref:Photosynthesis system II assembly factor Ycf48/Hcf136-like domain-containing protein n=1 Tax=Rubrivirga marina TaxID=1196024 RepID=A0A271J1C9_9BACT|nr:hypothetical protein [Rubrivirga marina]PAP77263.1 hypothetical protein BSZ37_12875 [Rubrivirga marina]